MLRIALSFFLFCFFSGCSCHVRTTTPSQEILRVNTDSLLVALSGATACLEKSNKKTFQLAGITISSEKYKESLKGFTTFLKTAPNDAAIKAYINEHFKVAEENSDAFFTGYYSPIIKGSLTKDSRYKFPIYSTPDDLVTVTLDQKIASTLPSETPVINRGRLIGKNVTIPYLSRKEINSGALKTHANIVAYAEDKIDLFFLHIQGSGVLILPDGSKKLLAYANKNGQPYRPIGKVLVDKGYLKKGKTSMQEIKTFLHLHPELVDEILHANPSYIFYDIKNDIPRGNLGVPVAAYHSFASDQKLIQPGILALVSASTGNGTQFEDQPMLNLDVGGAIKGLNHFDLYFGDGANAAEQAGALQSLGTIKFLVPR